MFALKQIFTGLSRIVNLMLRVRMYGPFVYALQIYLRMRYTYEYIVLGE